MPWVAVNLCPGTLIIGISALAGVSWQYIKISWSISVWEWTGERSQFMQCFYLRLPFFTFFTCLDLPNNVYHLLIFLYFFIFYILWITCADLPNLLAKERRGEKWPRSWGRQPRLLEMPKCWMIILIIVDYCWLYAIDNPQCLRCLDIRWYVGIDYWF